MLDNLKLKFTSIFFLFCCIMIALYMGSMTTYFTSYHPADLPVFVPSPH
jgi:hypothetical protein